MTVPVSGAGGGFAIDAAALRQQVTTADTDNTGQLEASEAVALGASLGLDERQAVVLTGLTTATVDDEIISRFALASASHSPDEAIALAKEMVASGNKEAAFDALHQALTRAPSPADCIKLATAAKASGIPLGEAAIARGCDLTTRATDMVVLAMAAHRLGLSQEASRDALWRGAAQATTVADTLRVAAACQDLGMPMAASVLDQAAGQSTTMADGLMVASAAVAGGHKDQAFTAAHRAFSLADSATALRDLAARLGEWQDAVPSLAGLRQACLQQAAAGH
jgi:hypothetical protein